VLDYDDPLAEHCRQNALSKITFSSFDFCCKKPVLKFKHPMMGVKQLTVGSQFEFHSARRPSVIAISYTALGNDGL
jgi:hypothetical protein